MFFKFPCLNIRTAAVLGMSSNTSCIQETQHDFMNIITITNENSEEMKNTRKQEEKGEKESNKIRKIMLRGQWSANKQNSIVVEKFQLPPSFQ